MRLKQARPRRRGRGGAGRAPFQEEKGRKAPGPLQRGVALKRIRWDMREEVEGREER